MARVRVIAKAAFRTGGLGVALVAMATGYATPDDAQVSATLRRVLEAHERMGDVGSASRLGELVALGPSAVPVVFAALAGSKDDADDGSEPPLVFGRRGEALVLEAVRTWPADRVASGLEACVDDEAPLERRLVAVRVLGATGNARSLGAFVRLLEPVDPIHLARPFVRARVERALADVLRRDPIALVELDRLLPRVPEALLPSVIEATGESGGAAGVSLIETFLEHGYGLDLRVAALRALGRLDVRGRALAGDHASRILREHLTRDEHPLRRQAADSLGRLVDAPSIPDLLDRLEDEDPGTRKAALGALRAIAGLRWGPELERWNDWYDAEEARIAAEGQRLRAALGSDDPGTAGAAIKELSRFRVERRRAAEVVAGALTHASEDVALSAVRALSLLGEPAALPSLIDGLYDARPKVRLAVHRELRRWTGEDVGPEPRPWLEWLYQ